jgi:hypothetical protein
LPGREVVHDPQRDKRAFQMSHQRNTCWTVGSNMAVIDKVQQFLDRVGGLLSLGLGQCHSDRPARCWACYLTVIVPPPRSVAMTAPLLPLVLAVTLVALIVPPPLTMIPCAYLPVAEILVSLRVTVVPLP